MKNLAVAFLFCLTGTLANAKEPELIESAKPVQCGDIAAVLATIAGPKFKEVPVWTGLDAVSRYGVFHNPETGSWTLLQFNDSLACVLGAGGKSSVLNLGEKS